MNWKTTKVLTVVALMLPAVNAAALRLIERNGSAPPVERVVAAVYIPRDGVIVIVPDLIFRAPF